MGWWHLKPREELDPFKCLRIDLDDVMEFVNIDVEDGYQISEVDKEHILNQITKEWNVAGEINDCDEP